MKKRIILLISILIIPIIAFFAWIVISPKSKKPSKQEVVSIENAQEKDICNKITPEELKTIFNIDYDKPSITKASVSGALSSDTCSFGTKDGNSRDNMQIVIKYATDNNKETVNQAWNQQTNSLHNVVNINGIGQKAIVSENTMYILNDGSYITVTKNQPDAEKIKQIFSDKILAS